MKTLNLSPNFFPISGPLIECTVLNFPSGCEPHIKLPKAIDADRVMITTQIKSANDIILVLLAADALRRLGVKKLELFIPYLPFARQDRVMVPGEPLSVKVMADLINSMDFDRVLMYDVHSEVSLALINNSVSLSNLSLVERALSGKENYLIASPDAGAYKKIFKLCQELKYNGELIVCNKVRDLSNGVIRALTVSHSDLEGKDVFIVDDICDGGGTFALLASVLKEKNAGTVNLIVSHGIFSKGEHIEGIDHIYTTDSFKKLEGSYRSLTQYSLGSII